MGVKPDMVISATFIIGAVLAAIAGVMYASNYGNGSAHDGLPARPEGLPRRRCLAASATWPARWSAASCWD